MAKLSELELHAPFGFHPVSRGPRALSQSPAVETSLHRSYTVDTYCTYDAIYSHLIFGYILRTELPSTRELPHWHCSPVSANPPPPIAEPILTGTGHPQRYPETRKGSNRWSCPLIIVDVMPLVRLQIIQNI